MASMDQKTISLPGYWGAPFLVNSGGGGLMRIGVDKKIHHVS